MFFKKWLDRDKPPATRVLNTVMDLQFGDLVSVKPRSSLPLALQGETLEVTAVCAYEYQDGWVTELGVKSSSNHHYGLTLQQDNGEITLEFSVLLSRAQVLALFGEEAFADLWEEGFAQLQVKPQAAQQDTALSGWLSDHYYQTENMATAYYHKRDLRQSPPSQYQDDDALELRYHECEGRDDHYGLTVEIWADGDTQVYLVYACAVDVISELWPHTAALE